MMVAIGREKTALFGVKVIGAGTLDWLNASKWIQCLIKMSTSAC